ncbi:MAG: hypothetical protein ACK4YO_03675, partial [Candidatus Altarchaeaceae archaeon]
DPYNISIIKSDEPKTINCNENFNMNYSIKFCKNPLVFGGKIKEVYSGQLRDVNESMIDENITVHLENIPKDGNFSLSGYTLTKSDEKDTAYYIQIQTYENWPMQVYLWAEPTKGYYYRVQGQNPLERKFKISGECPASFEPIEKHFIRFVRKDIGESCNYDDECKSNYCENKICAILQLNNITNSTVDNISNISSSTVIHSNITNSNISNSNVADSTIDNSNVINSSISYSHLTNSTITNAISIKSSIINSSVENSIANASTITNYSLVGNSNLTNSNISNSAVTHSNVSNSNIINNSFIANSALLNATTSNSTIYNSNITNSALVNSNIINSTINNTLLPPNSNIT